jgi:hypothetical protein
LKSGAFQSSGIVWCPAPAVGTPGTTGVFTGRNAVPTSSPARPAISEIVSSGSCGWRTSLARNRLPGRRHRFGMRKLILKWRRSPTFETPADALIR